MCKFVLLLFYPQSCQVLWEEKKMFRSKARRNSGILLRSKTEQIMSALARSSLNTSHPCEVS